MNGFVAAEALQDALRQLYLIDAIDENGSITSIGRTMAGIRFLSNLLILRFCQVCIVVTLELFTDTMLLSSMYCCHPRAEHILIHLSHYHHHYD